MSVFSFLSVAVYWMRGTISFLIMQSAVSELAIQHLCQYPTPYPQSEENEMTWWWSSGVSPMKLSWRGWIKRMWRVRFVRKEPQKEWEGREKKQMRTSSSRTDDNMCSVTIVQVTSNQANKFRVHANAGKDQTNKLSATFHHDSTW